LDFGLAKQTSLKGTSESMPTMSHDHLTSPGTSLGTIAYMSPEQARGKALDARTDLFSFGAVLYEMVTGFVPLRGAGTAEISDEFLNRAQQTPVRLNPSVPPELERIIGKALEKDRDVRYQHASEMRGDLKRLMRDTETGRISSATPSASSEKSIAKWAIAAAVALALIAGSYFLFTRSRPAPVAESADHDHDHDHDDGHEQGVASPAVQRVAVLPFRSLSGDHSDEAWGIGMTDAIITRLATLQNLAVRPTSSVLKYVKAPVEPTQAA